MLSSPPLSPASSSDWSWRSSLPSDACLNYSDCSSIDPAELIHRPLPSPDRQITTAINANTSHSPEWQHTPATICDEATPGATAKLRYERPYSLFLHVDMLHFSMYFIPNLGVCCILMDVSREHAPLFENDIFSRCVGPAIVTRIGYNALTVHVHVLVYNRRFAVVSTPFPT
jgi:hypothetical protein